MMSLSVALLLMLTFLFFWKLAKWKLVPRLNYPRSLPSLPIIGSLLQLAGQPQVHLLFHRLQQKYGNLYSLYMGSHYVVVVNNYLHAKEVLLKKGKIFAGRPRMVTTDLLTRNGKDIAFATYSPLWKFQRKLVHSALSMFGKGSLALEKIICQEAASLCGILNVTQESSLDIASELTRAVTNVVCNLCFKSSYHRGDAEFEAMLQYSQGIVDTVAKEGLVDIFPWLQSFPNKDLALLKQCVAMRDQLLYQQFAKHKEAFNGDSANDLMDVLLKAKLNMENNNSHLLQGQGLTEDHLLMTVADIFGAGVETTTTVLKWIVLYLLLYPEVQQKIQDELDQKVGYNRNPQLSDRLHMTYLEATISEVLRIRPVSPLLIPHEALEDTSIGEYDIPKGARIVINLWSIHHDEKEWDKPGEFNPGRFLDESGNHIYSPSPSYLPFGAGVRVCMGEVLAKMELFLFMAWILQRFTLSIPEGHTLPEPEGKFGVVLQVPNFKVKATLRKAWEGLEVDQ
ncbi:steroid 17-alpha-hydroxylase/17,20 lyase isoform X1 [Hemicordylus capensis]|uniref:steroid 17-alpha-hydroxylase/17,20 lyase isoform X1 n=1 Tax=Hemicordylus capensis TaxID=884348 RepID=UPI002303C2B9|nr:steroid 17-alpha-hydroxylase/17,20 lyase isoform X1 [Hemicordylus capensis]